MPAGPPAVPAGESLTAVTAASGDLPRRAVIIAIPAVSAVLASAAALGAAGCTSPVPRPAGARSFRFFTSHQAAVVEEATARIAPGPADDPAEAGHPGAREAGVTGYIDKMLGSLGALRAVGQHQAPAPVIFAGGPWSNRHAPGSDLMAAFIRPDLVASIAWRKRLAGWRQQYARGVATLDRLAGGDFTRAPPEHQDAILARPEVSTFTSLLFEHTIEGLYANPEYGGNRDLTGWQDIRYPGDVQPRGYTHDEVERSDGHDPVDDTGIVADVLKFLGSV